MATQEETDRLKRLMAAAQSSPSMPGSNGNSSQANVDLDVEGELGSFDLIPAGTFVLAYLDAEKTVSTVSNNNQAMIKAMWRVVEGEHKGRVLFDNYMLVGNGATRFLELADAFGYYDRDAKPKPKARCQLGQLVGPTKLAWLELTVVPERTVQNDVTGETRVYPPKNGIRAFGGITRVSARAREAGSAPPPQAPPAPSAGPVASIPAPPVVQAAPAAVPAGAGSWDQDPSEE